MKRSRRSDASLFSPPDLTPDSTPDAASGQSGLCSGSSGRVPIEKLYPPKAPLSLSDGRSPSLAVAAIAHLCTMWDADRLAALLDRFGPDRFGSVVAALGSLDRDALDATDLPDGHWKSTKRIAPTLDVERLAQSLRTSNATVTWGATSDALAPLANADPAPAVLFSRGDLSVLSKGPRVAIVGTRKPTSAGAQFAQALGRDLASAGCVIVSGLARGIDAKAHAGALHAGGTVIGVVGSGVDVLYPREHGQLFTEVIDSGVLITETPMGWRPEPFRFPQRNRLIAALADVLVVVESAERGGSMVTADLATQRKRPMMAVPGAPWSPASVGTNELLQTKRAQVCRGADDVMAQLGELSLVEASGRPRAPFDGRVEPSPGDLEVLRSMGWDVLSSERVAERCRRTPGATVLALTNLEADGWVHRGSDGWYRLAGPAGA
jgi:DNA processing protein